MPIIPEPSNFPSASKKGGNEPQNKQVEGEQRQKASATDHLSKGPQIPEGKAICSWQTCMKLLTLI